LTDTPSEPATIDKSELDNLCRQLELHNSGANAHSANKSRSYLQVFYRDKKVEAFRNLARQANLALATGDWKPLHQYMGRWW
jgi:hypothetical protein